MASSPKYSTEAFKRYLSDHPRATYQEMALAFSSTPGAIRVALCRYNIQLFSVPGRPWKNKDPRYPKEALEKYFASHPETTVKETAKFFGGSLDRLYKSSKRYGLTIPNSKVSHRKSWRKQVVDNL